MKVYTTFALLVLLQQQAYQQPGTQSTAVLNVFYTPVEKKVSYKVGERTIPVTTLQYGDRKDIACINLHDNEGTSVEAAKTILQETGGTLIKIENKLQRVIRFRLNGLYYGFDPNRMFSRVGIQQTLRDNGRISPAAITEVEKFAARILGMIADSVSCVIALHNNTNEAFSVRSYLPGGNRQRDARAVFASQWEDVDDIGFTTDSVLYKKMADAGYNMIWQDNIRAKKDGSLSVYYGEKNRRYINIETQHGKTAQYREMLLKLLAVLEQEKNEKPVTTDETTD